MECLTALYKSPGLLVVSLPCRNDAPKSINNALPNGPESSAAFPKYM